MSLNPVFPFISHLLVVIIPIVLVYNFHHCMPPLHWNLFVFQCMSLPISESRITCDCSVSNPHIWISQVFSSSGNFIGLFLLAISISSTIDPMAVFSTSDLLIHNFQLTGLLMTFYSLSKQSMDRCLFFTHMLQLSVTLDYPVAVLARHPHCRYIYSIIWVYYYWLTLPCSDFAKCRTD